MPLMLIKAKNYVFSMQNISKTQTSRYKQEKVRDNTYHMESASTAASAFFIYPAKSTNAIKYHVSKLQLMNNFQQIIAVELIKIKFHI